MGKPGLILASASPRRRELLEQVGAAFAVVVSDTDESVVPHDLPPELYVQELAMLKATAVAKQQEKGYLVIGADTVVVRGGEILGKPADAADAARMLRLLSGREHDVYTGIAVCDSTDLHTVCHAERTKVRFRPIDEAEIAAYIATGEPMDKAGAYGIQQRGSLFVTGVTGDFSNVVGLPLCALFTLLKREFDYTW